MIDLTDPIEIKALKEAFGYSFKGPHGERTMKFLEDFCHFYLGGPRDNLNQLQYEAGKRDVILTLKTILNEEASPKQIADTYKKMSG